MPSTSAPIRASSPSRLGVGETGLSWGTAGSTTRIVSPGFDESAATWSCSAWSSTWSPANWGSPAGVLCSSRLTSLIRSCSGSSDCLRWLDLELVQVGGESVGVGVGEIRRLFGVAGGGGEAEHANPRLGLDRDARVEFGLLALDRRVFVGEVEHGARLGQLVVEVGEAEKLFFGEDFAFRLAGRDDLAQRLAFVLIAFGGGDREDDDRGGDREQGEPAFAGPDETEISGSFHGFGSYREGGGST